MSLNVNGWKRERLEHVINLPLPILLPPETLAEIFSFLASEARVLVACSQAHPIFAQLVEPTLYAHVIVHDGDADHDDGHHLKFKPHQLSRLLSDNPRILDYLRSLCVDFPQHYNEGPFKKEIITILSGLKLERIQLTCTQREWFCLPEPFQTAFTACISTPYMKEICLDKIYNITLSTFADCTGLKRLTLCHSVWQSNNSFNFPHLAVETLKLSRWANDAPSDDFLSWVSTHACGLRSLTLTTSVHCIIQRFLPRLLAICSTSLVNLTIHYAKRSK